MVRCLRHHRRKRDPTGAGNGSDQHLPSLAARKPFLARASLRAQVGSRGAQPRDAETVRETRGKASSVSRLIQDRKPFPDLVSVSANGSQFRSNWDLGRGQKRFDQDTPAANGHRRETLEPVTSRHLASGWVSGQLAKDLRASASMLRSAIRWSRCPKSALGMSLRWTFGIRNRRRSLR